jgi:uncharacterized membrane protein YdjX (TVP38/TMEM64 family)
VSRRFFTLPRVLTLAALALLALPFVVSASARDFVVTATRAICDPDVPRGVRNLRDFLAGYSHHAWIVTSLLMVLQSIAAPIPAIPITLANAAIYGPWLGALVSWSSAQLASAVCFVIARSLGRPFVEKLFRPALLDRLDGFFTRDGLAAVLVMRLVPFVSFDVVSYAGGLTSIRVVPFLVATGIGQMPATIVYSHAGAQLVERPWAALKIALYFLGATAVVVAAVAWKLRARRIAEAAAARASASSAGNSGESTRP